MINIFNIIALIIGYVFISAGGMMLGCMIIDLGIKGTGEIFKKAEAFLFHSKPIYMVTGVPDNSKIMKEMEEGNFVHNKEYGASQTFFFVYSLKKAFESIERDNGGFVEGYYKWIVVEKYNEWDNLTDEMAWYEYVLDKPADHELSWYGGYWKKVEKPEHLGQTCNFAY